MSDRVLRHRPARPRRQGGRTLPASADEAPSPSSRREQIVHIAGRLFAEKGYVGTTIRDIAGHAQILPGSLYHHFPSKESIAEEILVTYWDHLLTACDEVIASTAAAPARVRGMIRVSVEVFDSHEHAVRLMLNDWHYVSAAFPFVSENWAAYERLWTTIVDEGVAAGSLRADVDRALACRTVIGMLAATGRWYRPGGQVTVDDLARSLDDLVLRGLAS